jgi:hypothetical protein
MRVLSPVGAFPLKLTGAHIEEHSTPVVDTAMGAWRSEVRFDRHDLPLFAAVAGLLVGVFLVGRLSSRSKLGS